MRVVILQLFYVSVLFARAVLVGGARLPEAAGSGESPERDGIGRQRRATLRSRFNGLRKAYSYYSTGESFVQVINGQSGLVDVSCRIHIENYSNLKLHDSEFLMEHGGMEIAPVDVDPGKKESLLARRSTLALYGTAGTVSWLIGNTGARLVIMFSVPFQHVGYSNCMAVGVYDGTTHGDDTWFDHMYEDYGSYPFDSTKACFDSQGETLHYSFEGALVSATMGSGRHPTINVRFMP